MPDHLHFEIYQDNKHGPRQRLAVQGPSQIIDAALDMAWIPDDKVIPNRSALVTRKAIENNRSRLLINASMIGRNPNQSKTDQLQHVKSVIGALALFTQHDPSLADPRLQLKEFVPTNSGLFHLDVIVNCPALPAERLAANVVSRLHKTAYDLNAYRGQRFEDYDGRYKFHGYQAERGGLVHDDRGNSSFYRYQNEQSGSIKTPDTKPIIANSVMRDDESPLIFLAGAIALIETT